LSLEIVFRSVKSLLVVVVVGNSSSSSTLLLFVVQFSWTVGAAEEERGKNIIGV
jgi:hypothetical protein